MLGRFMNERLRLRKQAKQELASILESPKTAVIIHYSCESFYDRIDGSSPRITSIAVRNYATGQTASFSIHQMAEREGAGPDTLETDYDRLEKQMLKEFYEYVDVHKNCKWVHWNMRDVNFGFAAIAHRAKVLKVRPVEIAESNLCDFARLLIDLFSPTYAGHPRLKNLICLNKISDKDFLSGAEEAKAFTEKRYVALHQSTLRKVDVMANIIQRTACGNLKTNATLKDVYGSIFALIGEWARDHPAVAIIGLIGSIASIAGVGLWPLIKEWLSHGGQSGH